MDFIILIIIVLIIIVAFVAINFSKNKNYRNCPSCNKKIKIDAKTCDYCNRNLL